MTSLPDWSALTKEQKDEIIRPLWAEGKSASEIAFYFSGASRNAIIGRVSRGKMKSGRVIGSTVRPKAPGIAKRMRNPENLDRPKPKMRLAMNADFVTIANSDPPSQSVMDAINSERPPLAGTVPIDILSLPNRSGVRCRFPVAGEGTNMMYCGAACGDKAYCPTHWAMAYKPTEKLRMPKEARR